MPAQIIRFPSRSIASRTPAQPAATGLSRLRAGEIDIIGVARRLHIAHCTPRTIINHIRAQVRCHGFPSPANPRLVCGAPINHGPDAVHWHSIWTRDAVESFFEAQAAAASPLPGGSAPAKVATMRARLAANASRLTGTRA